MSQRFGMADGRCFTINTADGLLNNYIMHKNGISYEDNYKYRQFLQSKGPSIINDLLKHQTQSTCTTCDTPLIRVPNNIY